MNAPSVCENNVAKKTVLTHLCVMAMVCLGVYLNAITNGFVGDDYGFITSNYAIRDLANTWRFFSDSKGTVAGYTLPEYGALIYRPLRTLSYAVDYSLFGLWAPGYHITSIFLHLISGVLLYFVAARLFKSYPVAFIASVLFALHPVHVEAVSWIASRADLIGFIFLCLSLLFYMRCRDVRSKPYLALAAAFSFLSYLGKETMVALPGIIVLYDIVCSGDDRLPETIRKRMPAWIVFSAVMFAYLFLRYMMTGRMDVAQQGWWGGNPYSNFLMMTKAAAIYLRLLALPVGLNLHYMISPVQTLLDAKVLVSALALLAYLALTVYFYFRQRAVCFTLAWFLLGLVPIANIAPISFSMMAERYIYMASAGPIMAGAYGIYALYKKAGDAPQWGPRVVAGATVLLLAAFSAQVASRNPVYKDDFAFYAAAVKSTPGSPPNLKGLADRYMEKKEYAAALEYFGKAIALDPFYAEAYMGIGLVHIKTGDLNKALENALKAAQYKPDNAEIRFLLGNIYSDMGAVERAAPEWERTVALSPAYSEAYNNLGVYYQMKGDGRRAIAMYESALRSNPDNVEAYYNIAMIYDAMGDTATARRYYDGFIRRAGPEYREIKDKAVKRMGGGPV